MPKNKRAVEILSWPKFKVKLTELEPKLNFKEIKSESDLDHNLAAIESSIIQALNESKMDKVISDKDPLILPKHIIELIKKKRQARNLFLKTRGIKYKIEAYS